MLNEPIASCSGIDLGSLASGWARLRTAFDARQHLTNRERLGDVVVGAKLEPDDLVNLGVLGRDHDDRHAAALAKCATEIEAAHPRQHQVEEDQVRP
jgi:hypothetical protein